MISGASYFSSSGMEGAVRSIVKKEKFWSMSWQWEPVNGDLKEGVVDRDFGVGGTSDIQKMPTKTRWYL